MSAGCALHYWVFGFLGFLGYCVLAFLRSTQSMKNQMFVYLASCFYLILLELQRFSEESVYFKRR
ncbi:MAG: hypothetical protein AB1765_07495 [Candidatus Hydrogenedentota bacterium]